MTRQQQIAQAQQRRQELLAKKAKLTFECDEEEFRNFMEPDEEENLLFFIKKYLLTEEQRKQLFDVKLSIEDCLNGRYGSVEEPVVHSIFEAWNKKLGFRSFGA